MRAVGEQHVRLRRGERREDLGERHLAALDGDGDAEVEPVALAGELAGRDADRQRLADVAVVGRLALDLDRRAPGARPGAAAPRSSGAGCRVGERAAVSAAVARRRREAEALQAGVAETGVARRTRARRRGRGSRPARRRERDAMRRRPRRCRPTPKRVHAVVIPVARVQDERGGRDLGRREGAVRRDTGAMPRRRAARSRRRTGRGRPPGSSSASRSSTRCCSRGGAGRASRTSRSWGFLGSRPSAVSEHTRPCPSRPRKSTGSRWPTLSFPTRSTASTSAAAVVSTGDVERQLTLVERHLAEARARVDERHPETDRFLEQRPDLRAAVAEVERLLVRVAVVVGHASSARLLRGAQLAENGDLVGAVLAALGVPRAEAVPGQRAVHPVAARTRSHQPGFQPRRSPARGAAVEHHEFDRERRAVRGDLRVDDGAERVFPTRRRLNRRGRRGAQRRCQSPIPMRLSRTDHERGDVLAPAADRAAALAVDERELATRSLKKAVVL